MVLVDYETLECNHEVGQRRVVRYVEVVASDAFPQEEPSLLPHSDLVGVAVREYRLGIVASEVVLHVTQDHP